MNKIRISKLKILIILFFIFFGLFGLAKSSQAATYYVATNGNDSNSGTQSAPFKTIQKAANIVNPGDTVYVRAGTYSGSVTLTKSGTAGSYITLRPYAGEAVYITTNAGVTNVFYGEDISYFKIIGFKIYDYTGYGIRFRGGGSHLEIRDNEIYDKKNAEPYIGTAIRIDATKYSGGRTFHTYTDVIIDGNNIHDTLSGALRYQGELLTVAFDIRRFQITNNTLTNAYHIGIDAIGKTWYEGDNCNAYPDGGIISGNTLTNIGTYDEDSSIYIDGGKNITIENNILVSNSGAGTGIQASIEDSTGTTENIIIRKNKVISFVRNTYVGATNGTTNNSRWVHNTFVMDDSNDYSNVSLLNGTGNIVKNNIFYATNGNRQMEHIWNKVYTVFLDYNDWFIGNMQFCYGGNSICYTNFTNYKTATGQDANSISSDPVFTNLSGNNLTLQSNSPCINAGDFLTKTTGSGTGTVIPVADARYFHDGYGIAGVSGDTIRIGSNTATITDVDYNANTITVDKNISWDNGDGVSYPYSGSAPDIGAYEYVLEDTTPPAAPSGLTVN